MISSLRMILSASTTGTLSPKASATAIRMPARLSGAPLSGIIRHYQELHLTSGRNHVNLRRVIPKCRIIFLLATAKLVAAFPGNISG